jgi:glutamate racemase
MADRENYLIEMNSAPHNGIDEFINRINATILITDSGLGGLSICADVVSRMQRQPLFENVRFIYFNAWPDQNRGYNRFDTIPERVGIFERALEGMLNYSPDLILIACNTLSALYDRTAFSRTAEMPVVDIIGFGVSLIHDALTASPESRALVLGTLTTIAENRHKQILVQKGIDPERVITQACDGLATAIEKNPAGEETKGLIDRYVREAALKIEKKEGSICAALCCTHFGYSASIIEQQIKRHVTDNVVMLNPNRRMGGFLFDRKGQGLYPEARIDVKVVSRIRIDDVRTDSISRLVKDRSPETAKALLQYEHKPDLFEF